MSSKCESRNASLSQDITKRTSTDSSESNGGPGSRLRSRRGSEDAVLAQVRMRAALMRPGGRSISFDLEDCYELTAMDGSEEMHVEDMTTHSHGITRTGDDDKQENHNHDMSAGTPANTPKAGSAPTRNAVPTSSGCAREVPTLKTRMRASVALAQRRSSTFDAHDCWDRDFRIDFIQELIDCFGWHEKEMAEETRESASLQ